MRHINQFRLALLLLISAVWVNATALTQPGKQNFLLHNETGVEIHSLYVSPHSKNDWEEDILGQETLASGGSVKVNFETRDQRGHWDLRVTDKNGNALEWYDLNLLEINDVTLHWDATKKKGWADIKKVSAESAK